MDGRSFSERYDAAMEKAHDTLEDMKYRKMADDYAKRHANDGPKEETDKEKIRRLMGLPPKPTPNYGAQLLDRESRLERETLHKFMGIHD